MPDRPHLERKALRSDPAGFGEVRGWIARIARAAGEDRAWGRRFALALHEAMTNVHRHSYEGRSDGRIDIRAEIRDDAIEIRVRDYGLRFDSETYVQPDPEQPSDDGGYGISLIRASVDEVRYAVVEHGTEIVLLKRRARSTTPATPVGADRGAHR